MDRRADRHAGNELLFRRVNERIEELAEGTFARGEQAHAWDFVCECHRADCEARLPLTVGEYELVREDGRRFIVAPSDEHVDPAIESVVDRSTRYWVVEKHGEPGERADAEDPRD